MNNTLRKRFNSIEVALVFARLAGRVMITGHVITPQAHDRALAHRGAADAGGACGAGDLDLQAPEPGRRRHAFQSNSFGSRTADRPAR